MESSRRDLLSDMAEHRPLLKNNQNTYHLYFGFTPKTGIPFPKKGLCTVFTVIALLRLRSAWRRNMKHERWKIPNFFAV